MGYLERNSETWKTPGFSGFECRVSGIGRVSIFGFGSGSGSKKVGLFPRVSGFRVQRPITTSEPYTVRLTLVCLWHIAARFASLFWSLFEHNCNHDFCETRTN